MRQVLERWYLRYFTNEETTYMVFIALCAFAVLFFLGSLLTPLFVAIILAYLMQGMVVHLKRYGLPHVLSVSIVFTFFISILSACLFGLLPLVWSQALRLIDDQLPVWLRKAQETLSNLVDAYPDYFSETQVAVLTESMNAKIGQWGEALLSLSIHSVPSIFGLMIFLVLVPVLVFFLLKDRERLTNDLVQLLPARRPIMNQVWTEMNRQMANYVRGKVIEIIIVGGVTFACFTTLGLKYAALLSLVVGLSVLIPFIGAALATIPVFVVAYFQMGWGSDLATVMIVYAILQALDGNVLVPLLFSEAVNLHPVAIVTAVLVFGGLWGVWGVFFAIPLATLVKALWTAWPTHQQAALDDSTAG